jgi:hypothetical protein
MVSFRDNLKQTMTLSKIFLYSLFFILLKDFIIAINICIFLYSSCLISPSATYCWIKNSKFSIVILRSLLVLLPCLRYKVSGFSMPYILCFFAICNQKSDSDHNNVSFHRLCIFSHLNFLLISVL